MQFIKQLLGINQRVSNNKSQGVRQQPRLRVAILGTGKIGADLLVKVVRSDWLDCVLFAGRNLDSDGMRFAARLGVPLSDKGIAAFYEQQFACDLVFDATSAACHLEHAQVFDKLGIFAIDMTPSQIGECCVPALGMEEVGGHRNISMISCGGQSSIPVAQVLYNELSGVKRMQVKSLVSANSIGPGTLANINEYYRNTKAGLRKYTGDIDFDVDLIVDSVNLETPMRTTITAEFEQLPSSSLASQLDLMVSRVQAYVPGYQLISGPHISGNQLQVEIQVEGLGDYLPRYAGNLDIINCAAIAVAEDYARIKARAWVLSPSSRQEAEISKASMAG